MTKVALITNIPAPYREKLHESISEQLGGNYTVIYCAEKEDDRKWTFKWGNYKKVVLAEFNKSTVHNNRKIWGELKKLNPDVVITGGFYPTMLYAFLWTILRGKKHLVFTDGTFKSEQHLSRIHRIIRKIVFARTKGFIGISDGSKELYKSYGVSDEKLFRSYLSVSDTKDPLASFSERPYDLMYSGRFIELKLPLFFAEVAKNVKEKLGRCKVLVLGAGPMKEELLGKLDEYGIEYDYPGFIAFDELPAYYKKAKVFLFPTRNDTWGIVANEAMTAGTPVITCADAGVAHDLVVHEKNGFVLPIDSQQWADACVRLLTDPELHRKMSTASKSHVAKYSFENAARGFIDAIKAAKK